MEQSNTPSADSQSTPAVPQVPILQSSLPENILFAAQQLQPPPASGYASQQQGVPPMASAQLFWGQQWNLQPYSSNRYDQPVHHPPHHYPAPAGHRIGSLPAQVNHPYPMQYQDPQSLFPPYPQHDRNLFHGCTPNSMPSQNQQSLAQHPQGQQQFPIPTSLHHGLYERPLLQGHSSVHSRYQPPVQNQPFRNYSNEHQYVMQHSQAQQGNSHHHRLPVQTKPNNQLVFPHQEQPQQEQYDSSASCPLRPSAFSLEPDQRISRQEQMQKVNSQYGRPPVEMEPNNHSVDAHQEQPQQAQYDSIAIDRPQLAMLVQEPNQHMPVHPQAQQVASHYYEPPVRKEPDKQLAVAHQEQPQQEQRDSIAPDPRQSHVSLTEPNCRKMMSRLSISDQRSFQTPNSGKRQPVRQCRQLQQAQLLPPTQEPSGRDKLTLPTTPDSGAQMATEKTDTSKLLAKFSLVTVTSVMMKNAFNKFVGEKGFLTVEDLPNVLRHVGIETADRREEIDKLFKIADTNNDGRISQKELLSMLNTAKASTISVP